MITLIKIAMIGIVAVLLGVQFKKDKEEYGLYLGLVACLLIFLLSIPKIEVIIETIHTIQGYIKINNVYIEILIKIIGITYVAEFSSSICKDAGHGAIGGQIELIGKLSILAISMPILLALLETIHQFLSV